MSHESNSDTSKHVAYCNAPHPVQQINVANLSHGPEELPPSYDTLSKPSPQAPLIGVPVIQNVPAISRRRWPRFPIDAVCPHCGTVGHTRVENSSTCLTFALAVVLSLLCLCLFVVPFLIPSCKRTTHYCSRCSAVLAEINAFD